MAFHSHGASHYIMLTVSPHKPQYHRVITSYNETYKLNVMWRTRKSMQHITKSTPSLERGYLWAFQMNLQIVHFLHNSTVFNFCASACFHREISCWICKLCNCTTILLLQRKPCSKMQICSIKYLKEFKAGYFFFRRNMLFTNIVQRATDSLN